MRKLMVTMLLLVLPAAGAVLGSFSASAMSRANDKVKLLDRIEWEERTQSSERTLESDAFRRTGRTVEELAAEAGEIQRRFRMGTPIFGAWCGLVIGLSFVGINRSHRRDNFEVDVSQCVQCGRCFRSCPRERQRTKQVKTADVKRPIQK